MFLIGTATTVAEAAEARRQSAAELIARLGQETDMTLRNLAASRERGTQLFRSAQWLIKLAETNLPVVGSILRQRFRRQFPGQQRADRERQGWGVPRR
jgi:hypothetical protein